MKKLNLHNVTLFCLDIDSKRGARAIATCANEAVFGEIQMLSLPDITDLDKYSHFMLKDLANYVQTEYVLIVQHDGYIVNTEAWTDEFLKYDYIGAPWWYEDGLNVGNGGFSLRSKRLIDACAEFDFDKYFPEDDVLCRRYRREFEAMGFKWAPEHLAARFSWEGNAKYPRYNGSFGFHGRSNVKLFQR